MEEKSWKERILSWLDSAYKLMLRYPVAIVGTILIVLFAGLAVTFGQSIQIGGILERLWGKKESNIDVRLLPPPGRVDEEGKIIYPGQSDDKGFVQAPADLPIVKPGIFSNPNEVKVVHPTRGEISIPLPKGVKNTDVSEVYEVESNVYEVKNNDRGVDVESLLKKL